MREPTWGDYGAVLRRYWWLLVLLVVIPGIVAFAWTAAQPKRYRAQAKLLNISTITDANSLNLDTAGVGVTITTPAVLAHVSKKYGGALPAAGDYTVTAAAVSMSGDPVAPSALSPTRLVIVTVEASGAEMAARLANAYAAGYVAYRKEFARTAATINIRSVEAQLRTFDSADIATLGDYLASQYVTLQQRLSDLKQTARSGNGGYSVAAPAGVPTAPFEPQPARAAILGLGAGLVLAFLAALGLQLFGRRLASGREAAELLDLQSLGSVPLVQSRSGRPALASLGAPGGEGLEDYRRLRATVTGIMARHAVRSLLLTSARSGEGSSRVAAELGVLLARSGRHIVVVDGDLRSPKLDGYFAASNEVGLSTVLAEQVAPDEAIVEVDLSSTAQDGEGAGAGRLELLAAGPAGSDPGETIAALSLAPLIRSLAARCDLVVISGAAMEQAADTAALAEAADALLFVVNPRVATRGSLKRCREWLNLLPCRLLGLVMVRGGARAREEESPAGRALVRTQPAQTVESASGSGAGSAS
jgi:receptor protein-tyrosine kinase